MKQTDQLVSFVEKALSAGKSRDEIRAAMSDAGWSPSEVDAALRTWAESDFVVPVPRPRPLVTAREVFVYGLMFLALAATTIHAVLLLFNLINLWIPDPANSYPRWDADDARFSVAWIIVFGPVFLIMNQRAASRRKSDPAERRSAVRKWLGYAALFVAAIALLGDLIWIIYSLLDGELTARVIAKAVALASVAGGVFVYYRADMAEIEDA